MNLTAANDSSATNSTEEDVHYLRIYLAEGMLLSANLTAIAANLIILYVMIKFYLYKTMTYTLIANWAALDILHLVTSPGIYHWYRRLHEVFANYRVFRVYFNLYLAFEFSMALTMHLLVVKREGTTLFVKLKYFIWGLVVFFMGFINIVDIYGGKNLWLYFSFATLILSLFIMCLIYYRKEAYITDNDHKLRINLALTYSTSRLILIATIAIEICFQILPMELLILGYTIPETNSIVTFYILIKMDKLFQEKILGLFRRDAVTEPEDKVSFAANRDNTQDGMSNLDNVSFK